MRVRRDRLVTRALGVCLGIGFLVLGLVAVVGSRQGVEAIAGNRALGVGLALVVAGAAAIVASLTVADPNRIW